MAKLYMKVGPAPYELPEFVSESVQELARVCGVKVDSIYTMISKGYGGFLKIEVSEEDEE